MEGLGLGSGTLNELDVREKVLHCGKMPRLTDKDFVRDCRVYSVINGLDDEELDKIIADCRAGKWSKKLPGKPWYFGLLSKKSRDKKFLYFIEFSAAMRKYERKAYKNILNDPDAMEKITEIMYKANHKK